ncbi:competence type IV pilus assembly protein ComGB [Bacillus sp. REN3]|uniref:competence type IV pilus assembly protein ComGB n=1 Tax=Bacillus sp. REN3 TaxID=2802440 RepID=UPI001AEEA311|nr:competence type IV pilus assembly protein ComGB [Bacillus sp. REN3]
MGTKWPAEEQARFLKRTGELLSRGYPLAEAFESLSFYLEKKRKEDIKNSLRNLREGYPLHLILGKLGFKKELVSYVYFAEQHGSLAKAVIEGSEMVLRRNSDYQRLKRLGTYPLFLVILTGVLFYFIQQILLPKFTALFNDMDLAPNIFIRFINASSSLLPVLSSLIVAAAIICYAFYIAVFKNIPPVKQRILLTKIPVVGKLMKLYYTHYFSSQLSYLFAGGLSVFGALKIFEENLQDDFSAELGKDLIMKLLKGQDFDEAILDYTLFEAELPRIVRHGQKNGKLDQELYFYSRHCLNQLEERTEKMMKVIQPLLYSFIGLLIISLYLAILLPMFQLIQGI